MSMPDASETPEIRPEDDEGGHPLFPRPETETGPDRRKFDIIQVVRWLPDNTKEVCPKAWKGSELRSWEQITDLYGGECTYQLIAQDGKAHRYTAWSEKHYFASPARRPFSEPARAPAPRPEPAPAAAPTPAPAAPMPPPPNPYAHPAYYAPPPPPPPASNQGDMVGLLRVILESNSSAQAAILRAVLERPAAPVLPAPPPAPNPIEMLRELVPILQAGGGANNSAKTLMQGIQLAREMYKGGVGRASGGGGDDLGDLAGIFKLIGTLKGTQAAQPTAPAAQPAAAPAVLSPAAILRTVLADPSLRAQLRAALVDEPTQPAAPVQAPSAAVPPAAPVAPTAAPAAPVPPPAVASPEAQPDLVDLDPETRELLEQPDFRDLVSSMLPAEARESFEVVVAQNAARLRATDGGDP